MSYIEQREKYLREHPNATPEEIWNAGYWTCSENWCKGKR